jgi:mono/diheme cytochrome c family protein
MNVLRRSWGFGSALLGLIAALGFVAASSAVPSAQAPASPAAPSVKPVTFTKDIAPILQRSCQNCHRPDQMAPMSLLTYEDARPYARSIKARTTARAMPPWHVERNIGIQKFKDDPSLTDEEIATIAAWVDQGAPKGNMADMPPAKQFDPEDMWHFKPDLVVEMPTTHVVPANGADEFIDFISDSGLSEDRYVRAIETKPGPGARAVTHHLLTYLIQDVDPSEALIGQNDGRQGGSNETFLNEYAVGKNGDFLPEGTGKLMKAGAKVRFSVHYHSSGKETADKSRVAIQFYPKGYVPKYHQISLQIAHADGTLDLPAGVVSRSDGYYRFDKPVHITAIQAHMHNLGKRMCVEAILPTNTTEQLNCVGWDFNWHKVYNYADDVSPLYPAGTVLHTILWHDNSAANRANPDPRNWRGYGQRTLDEMAFAWITWSNLTEEDYKTMVAARKKLSSN